MKNLVVYSSKTGNTEKVAKAIQIGMENSDCLKMNEVENLNNYKLLVIGGWIDKGTFNAEVIEFIKEIKDREVAFFYTLGAYPDSDHAKSCTNNIIKLLEDNGNKILGSFLCQGAIDPKLMEFMSKLPQDHPMAPNPERIKRWKDAASHPDEKDLAEATAFGKNLSK